ncbi:hypothetical protein Q4601_14390 [Shewanella sp. 1_MG-2023]|uniref:hypothetical protein n=1 Tax=unclassified Shewanella TaxID=196818 RepID=UPI0026E48C9D|nr:MULTISPECIES: hypothetical protein [unclassified Shewanella]MDO6611398.1 hypothetical protein [Shewanella sp. 7_MG-2023]MDO6771253.1 hypothetical protein [Shewanella sp. 2_MG-2023]MDO6795494.1 hypothetical protein [Shewanella sp. 1_MG-2023]
MKTEEIMKNGDIKTNKYIIFAIISSLIIIISYIFNFYTILEYSVSHKPEDWSHFSSYVGGILSPALTFISLALLIKSLNLQNQANASLREELVNSKQTEKIRAFEALFFNMIESQKNQFNSLNIEFPSGLKLKGIDAVLKIEDDIELMRKQEKSNDYIKKYLSNIDSKDQIFGLTRSFFVIVKNIEEKLSNKEGFDNKIRNSHFMTLINFTDFSQLRLLMISIQFLNYHSTSYLKNSTELGIAIKETGLSFELY